MLKMLLRAWLLWTLLAAAPVAQAATDAATAETLTRQYGLWEQLSHLKDQVRAGFLSAQAQSGRTASDTELQRLTKIVDTAYAADRLRAVAVQVIQSDTDEQHLPALQAWFGSDLGALVRRLEEAASASQTDPGQVLQQGAAQLQAMSGARRDALADISRTVGAAEAITRLVISTTLASHLGLRSVMPDAPGPSTAELEAALQAQRPQMLQTFEALSLAGMALSYQALSDDDLAQYLVFLKSPAGQHANDIGLRAYTAAMIAASADMGQRLPGLSDKANT
jgi:hypothetical protein